MKMIHYLYIIQISKLKYQNKNTVYSHLTVCGLFC